MRTIQYINLEELNPEDLRLLLNKPRVRAHLIEHKLFDSITIKLWLQEKIETDCTVGCRVRGIIVNDAIAGWCGVQFENERYEIAIVLDDKFWGIGKEVFIETMSWAKELGHHEVFIHFLHTRPAYKFLRKISKDVFETDMFGRKFTTYQISVV